MSVSDHPPAPLPPLLAAVAESNPERAADSLILLDTETTGLDHKVERLIEVAAVRLEAGEVVASFSELINPGVPIRHSSFQIHGISEEMIADAPGEDVVIPRLLEFMGETPFAAHNAIFDYSFINAAHKRLYSKSWKIRRIDTLELYRCVFPDEPSHGLSSLLARFGYNPEVKHRALDDAMCLAQVYPRLRQLYIQRYQWQFAQLPHVEYLLERYLRMQRAIQMMHSEMSDLKEIFKLHFTEGGKPLTATTGEMMVSNTRRSYEYDDAAVWPLLFSSGLVERGSRLNSRALDKLVDSQSLDADIRDQLRSARSTITETRTITFIKPSPKAEEPVVDKVEDASAEAEDGSSAGVSENPESP
ncbi:MAG: 3'-5' exonuclease [Vampirovibrionales bacterium]|nr:3'-5' exonuclease [Vampirovibrionales bacterium]